MRIFLTGATGWVGSAVTQELIQHGHIVLGLARNDANAAALTAAGAQPHPGSLEDLGSLRSGADAADAVIHCGFIHDFARFPEVCAIDKLAIETLGATLAGSNRPLVVTSGTGLIAPGTLMDENTPAPADSGFPRVSEQTGLAFAAQGVNATVVRLPPTVHGNGDQGFISILVETARKKGVAAYIGEGHNHWPAVHRSDAATLYRLAVERGTPGAIYHAIAEQGVQHRDIATAIGHGLHLPIVSKSPDEASAHFGWFAHFATLDNRASSALTQERLSWSPTGPTLLHDLAEPHYFQGQTKYSL